MRAAASDSQRSMPSDSDEKPTANRNTVNTSVTAVRGMIVAGRRVSCAACDMDSRPTKASIARDAP
jgi:hypothetical protein